MADDFDFQIDNLKFRAAISDQFPYSRGTAPFRKEQVDQSQKVGDQSLTGWWTRGQFSFHKGLGIKFYEILDGEGVLDRYRESHQIDPWEAGRLSLHQKAGGSNLGWTWDATGGKSAKHVAHSTHGLYVLQNLSTSPFNRVVRIGGQQNGTTETVATTSVSDRMGCLLSIQDAFPNTVLVSVGATIQKSTASAAAFTTLWTISDAAPLAGAAIERMFFAKDRLWVCNNGGRWYTLDLVGGTVPSGGGSYVFWDSPKAEYGTGVNNYAFSFADSPGPVFFARTRYIWATTVNEDGTIAEPYVVADLGPDVIIEEIVVNRGRMGIITRNGFCVAEILGDDGTLVVGPLYIPFEDGSRLRGSTSYNDFIYFGAKLKGDTDYSIVEVKLNDDVAELEPAYVVRERQVIPTTGSGILMTKSVMPSVSYSYIRSDTSGTGAAYGTWRAGGFIQDKATSGWLITGQHRMGTLEKKQFYAVTVTAETTGTQSIEVYRVDKDGVETRLWTGVHDDGTAATTATDGLTTFDLSSTDPVESMGFKFLLRKGTDLSGDYSPRLLGYQVKALPVPQRQRILRWPLSIQDLNKLRRGTGSGRAGRAYEDLTSLEALESSQAIVTFTDHRTGETGQAYIDSVEFQSDTPPGPTTDGFGGVAYVTLRVLS